jgi:hypothetical protein
MTFAATSNNYAGRPRFDDATFVWHDGLEVIARGKLVLSWPSTTDDVRGTAFYVRLFRKVAARDWPDAYKDTCYFDVYTQAPLTLTESWALLSADTVQDHAYMCPDFFPHRGGTIHYLRNTLITRV